MFEKGAYREPMAQTAALSFEYTSFIPDVTREDVWRTIGNWDGVNNELGPLIKMSYPKTYAQLADIPADGKSHFTAGVTLFGIIPIDRHKFAFVGKDIPNYFDERSSNLNMKFWSHKRTLIEREGGVEVTDTCAFIPRIGFMGGFLGATFSWVFRRRHQRLKKQFGVS